MQFLLSYNDNDDYTMVRPYDLQQSMMINKDIKDISKGTPAQHQVNYSEVCPFPHRESRITNVLFRFETTTHVEYRESQQYLVVLELYFPKRNTTLESSPPSFGVGYHYTGFTLANVVYVSQGKMYPKDNMN